MDYDSLMGQNVSVSQSPQSTQVNGKQGSSYGMWGGIISALHDGVFDWVNMGYNRKMAQKQIDMQYEFAKNGIQWRVADAKKAGLHPLYALGANTPTYTPVDMSMGQYPSGTATRVFNSALAGQQADLALENAELQNELLKSQIDSNYAQSSAVLSQTDSHSKGSLSAEDVQNLVTQSLDSKYKGNGQYSAFGLNKEGFEQALQEFYSENPRKFVLITALDKMAQGKKLSNKELDLLGAFLGVHREVDKSKGERSYGDVVLKDVYQFPEAWGTLKDWASAGLSKLKSLYWESQLYKYQSQRR